MFRRFMVAAVAALAIPASSQAVFTITLSSSGGGAPPPLVVTDNVAPDIQPLASIIQLGSISMPGPALDVPFVYAGYNIGIISSAWSTPLGSASLSSTTIIVIERTAAAVGDLTLVISETGFGAAPYDPMANGNYMLTNDLTAVAFFTASGTVKDTGSGLVSATSSASPALATTPTVSLGPAAAPAGIGSAVLFTKTASPFTKTQTLVVSGLTAGESVQFQATSTLAVPAPKSVILALAGLPMIGLFGWLRARRKSVESVGAVA